VVPDDAWLAAIRADAEAKTALEHGQTGTATRHEALAVSCRATERAYRDREHVFAGVTDDRVDWERATKHQRYHAVAADAELRRRHPTSPSSRCGRPSPSGTLPGSNELNLSPGQPIPETGQWIMELAAARSAFAAQLADRQSVTIPHDDPDHGRLGQAFPAWPEPGRDAILQPPRPQIAVSARVLERPRDREADLEAGN